MNKMFTFLSSWILSSRTPLLLNDFKEVRYTSPAYPSDCFVNNKPRGVLLEERHYDKKDTRIGYIRYYITTGHGRIDNISLRRSVGGYFKTSLILVECVQ
jgi:hypothetical protein